mgnify:CR=1 FL=1
MTRTTAVSLLAMALAAIPLGAEPLSLSEALRRAEMASFRADNARLERAKALEETGQVKSLYLPEVNFQGGHLNLDERPELRFGPVAIGPLNLGGMTIGPLNLGPMGTPTADKDSWRYKLSVDYLLYDFGKREKALSATRAKEEAIGLKGGEEIKQAQAEVAARYVALLNVKAQRQVLFQRRKSLEDHLKTVQDLYQNGVVARNDLLRTEVALRGIGDVERALDSAEAAATEALNVAMGQEATTPLELPDGLEAPPALPWDETSCRTRAAQGNEGVKALKAKTKALQKQVELKRGDYTPNVVAEAAHSYEQNSWSLHPHENALYIGLSWKVFDGARSSKVRHASAELEQGKRETLEAERQAGNAAVAAYRDVQVALQEVQTAEANVRASEENLRIVEDQYKEGLAKSTDALDAEAVLADSRFSLAAKRYRAYARQAALLATLGEDLPAFYSHVTTIRIAKEK